jgi:hypothetical protein
MKDHFSVTREIERTMEFVDEYRLEQMNLPTLSKPIRTWPEEAGEPVRVSAKLLFAAPQKQKPQFNFLIRAFPHLMRKLDVVTPVVRMDNWARNNNNSDSRGFSCAKPIVVGHCFKQVICPIYDPVVYGLWRWSGEVKLVTDIVQPEIILPEPSAPPVDLIAEPVPQLPTPIEPEKVVNADFTMPADQAYEYFQTIRSQYFVTGNNMENWLVELHAAVQKKIESLQPLQDYSSIKVTIFDKAAGAGKTTTIVREFDPSMDFYITANGKSLADFREAFYKRFKGISCPARTFEKALTEKLENYKRIMVDESFALPMAYYVVLFTAAPFSEFRIFGDKDQTQYLDKYGVMFANQGLRDHLQYFTKIERDNQTWRFGPTIVKFLQEKFQYDVVCHPKNQVTSKITYSQWPNRIMRADLNITFTDATKKYLNENGVSCLTVKESQGSTANKVNLFIDSKDSDLMKVRDLAIVSCSRAVSHLNFVELFPGVTSKAGWQDSSIQLLSETATNIVAPQVSFSVSEETVKAERIECARHTVGKFDPLHVLKLAPEPYYVDNQIESKLLVAEKTVNGMRINLAKIAERKALSERNMLPTKFGKTYRVASKLQTILTSAIRLANNKRRTSTIRLKGLNRLAADRFRRIFLKPSIELPQHFVDEFAKSLEAVYQKYRSKLAPLSADFNAPLSWEAIDANAQPWHCTLKMHLKQIQKIRGIVKSMESKAGQDIVAWAKEINAMCCPLFRTLEKLLVENLKPQFIWGNGISEEELGDRLNAIKGAYRALCMDFPEFDASQTEVSIQLEQFILEYMYPLADLEFYYEMRKMASVHSPSGVSYDNKGRKTSGEPATLFTNTLLNMALTVAMVPEDVLIGGSWKGDDSIMLVKEFAKFLLDFSLSEQILQVTPKMLMPVIPDFCGYLYSNGKFFYNYSVLACKILSRNYGSNQSNLSTICDYQESVKDKLQDYLKSKDAVLCVMCAYLCRGRSAVECGMENIVAFTQLKQEEVANLLTEYTYEL